MNFYLPVFHPVAALTLLRLANAYNDGSLVGTKAVQ